MLILSFSPISSDARVLKQIELFRDEWDVVTFGYGPAPDGVVRHVRLPDDRVYWRYDRLALVARLYRRAYWHNPAVASARKALAGETFDVVIANDIDTVPLALALAPRIGVHADLHEYAPRQKEDNQRWRLFVAPFIRWICRRHLPRVASITTVANGIAAEYRRCFGVDVEVVTNSAPYARIEPTPVDDPIRLVHSGACLPDRGIEQLVAAVIGARTEVSLDLYLMPNDPPLLESIRAVADSNPRITLHPPVPYAQLVETLNGYDVGVHVLPPVNFNNAWALPNKIFDYVQARLGVIVGPSPEMEALVREREIGAVADDFTTAALIRVLDDVDRQTVARWKSASDAAAFDLSAGAQVEVWRRAIERIAGKA